MKCSATMTVLCFAEIELDFVRISGARMEPPSDNRKWHVSLILSSPVYRLNQQALCVLCPGSTLLVHLYRLDENHRLVCTVRAMIPDE